MYVPLKLQGVDTELIRLPEESHGLGRGGRPDRRIERLRHISCWFDKYVKKYVCPRFSCAPDGEYAE